MTISISNWYLRPPRAISRSRAPMTAYTCIAGAVSGHVKHPDGKRITTSPVVRFEGRNFWTASGTAYVLEGDPLPEHVRWLERCGCTYNPADPLMVIPELLP